MSTVVVSEDQPAADTPQEPITEVVEAQSEAEVERIAAHAEAEVAVIEARTEAEVELIEARTEAETKIIEAQAEAREQTEEQIKWTELINRVATLETTISALLIQLNLTLTGNALTPISTVSAQTEVPPEPKPELSDESAVPPETLANDPPAPATPVVRKRKEIFL